MKFRTQLGLLVPLLGLLLSSGPAVAEDPRWPLWPSELQRIHKAFAPNEEGIEVPDTERLAAIRVTDAYATPLIEPILLQALKDSSVQVVRDALIRCIEREILACTPESETIWANTRSTTSLRMYALRVLLLDPTKEHVDHLLAAMQSADPQIRTVA
ncbi:MAG: hypothetical protein ACPG77_06100, partial [Nannocystaceae bacterium]